MQMASISQPKAPDSTRISVLKPARIQLGLAPLLSAGSFNGAEFNSTGRVFRIDRVVLPTELNFVRKELTAGECSSRTVHHCEFRDSLDVR